MSQRASERPLSSAQEARRLLRLRLGGTLCTLSLKFPGYPFASVAPFVLDHAGRPVLLVSRLAEHTRNMEADPRVSLLAHEAGDDLQAGARVTVLGKAARVDEPPSSLTERWLRYFPQGGDLLALGDFSFFAIEPDGARFIRGFGAIHWIGAEALRAPDSALAEAESGVVEHMNADHAGTLRDYCRALHGVDAPAVMLGLDCEGFDLRAGERRLRVDFAGPVRDAQDARRELVALAHRCRGQ